MAVGAAGVPRSINSHARRSADFFPGPPLSYSFFGWLSIDHPHNNVHNIRICRLLVEAGALSAAEVAELSALQRVSGQVDV